MSKTILITGVGKRIGLSLAKHFMAQGHKVIGTYRRHYQSIDELKKLGASLYQCDLNSPLAIEGLIANMLEQHPRLDTVIHNASDWLADPTDSDDLSPNEVMLRMLQVHVTAPYQLNLALAPLLIQSALAHNHTSATQIGASNIIHITDYVAEKGSKKHIAYAASKAALHNMTLSFATKLAPNVKVNSIAPAMILFNEQDDLAYKVETLAKSILPKEAGSQEIIALVEYLQTSHYVTGRSFAVDGGRHLM